MRRTPRDRPSDRLPNPGRLSDHREGSALATDPDAEREYAYDCDAHFGRLDKALDEAPKRGWTVVDMKNDWREVFPPRK